MHENGICGAWAAQFLHVRRSTAAIAAHRAQRAGMGKIRTARTKHRAASPQAEELRVSVPKQLKKQLRHEKFLQKLESSATAKRRGVKKSQHGEGSGASAQDVLLADVPAPALDFNPFAPKPAGAAKQNLKTKKGRAKLLLDESVRLFKVLGHPAFQRDPAGTIAEHLKNTHAPQ